MDDKQSCLIYLNSLQRLVAIPMYIVHKIRLIGFTNFTLISYMFSIHQWACVVELSIDPTW